MGKQEGEKVNLISDAPQLQTSYNFFKLFQCVLEYLKNTYAADISVKAIVSFNKR
jgi:hypothetical protein